MNRYHRILRARTRVQEALTHLKFQPEHTWPTGTAAACTPASGGWLLAAILDPLLEMVSPVQTLFKLDAPVEDHLGSWE